MRRQPKLTGDCYYFFFLVAFFFVAFFLAFFAMVITSLLYGESKVAAWLVNKNSPLATKMFFGAKDPPA